MKSSDRVSGARLRTCTLSLAFAASLTAQIPQASGPVLLAMGANAKRVMQYGWKQRVTVVRKGKPAEPVINQVGFNGAGQMQRTTLSPPPREMSGIRGRVAADVKKNVEEIMQLAAQYNKPQQIVAVIQKAQTSQSPATNTIEMRATGVIKPADSVTIFANGTTHLASHIDIKTDYDGSPVSIAQDYESITGGVNVLKTMKVSAPGKDLVVNVDSYEFTPKSPN